MELTRITDCKDKDCPAVYRTSRATFVIRGAHLDADTLAEMAMPAHEGAVEIPGALVDQLLRERER
jgi:hypothetical protein